MTAKVATGLVVLAAIVGSCGGSVTPAPTTTPSATPSLSPVTEQAQMFYARLGEPPIAVPVQVPVAASVLSRIRVRLDALAHASPLGPGGAINLLPTARAALETLSVDQDLAKLDFAVSAEDWGLASGTEARAFMQQIVFTATDEQSISQVLVTRDGGKAALIAASDVIVTYHAPLTREAIASVVESRPVGFFARDGQLPIAVVLEGAGIGPTAEERIHSRLIALERGPAVVPPDAYNIVRGAKARLSMVQVAGDLVELDYLAPQDEWGIDGSARLLAFLQQIVYTATEETGITRVLITQNGGQRAIIGGEGLIVDHPATRADVSRALP